MKVAHDEEADRIVVGWPRSLSGRDGPAARSVRDEVVELRSVAGATCSVELYDERFSTITATERLREARPTPRRDRSRRSPRAGGAGRRSRRTVEPVDAAAAAVILQSYLDIPTRPREAP